jgi:peptide/nickel transport system permease protein
MKGYILKRTIDSSILLVFALTLNFFLFRFMPGDPAIVMVSSTDDPRRERLNLELIQERWGLDRPIYEQFILYVRNILPSPSFDFGLFSFDLPFVGIAIPLPDIKIDLGIDMGESFNFATLEGDRSVTKVMLGDRLINSMVLMGTAIVLSLIIAMILGTIAAWKYGTKTDIATVLFSLLTYSMPVFWFGIMIIFFFHAEWQLLPVGGVTEPGTPSVNEDFIAYYQDYIRHMIGPAITLTISFIGGWFLIMRDTLLNIFTEDYMHSAYAKGISTRRILFTHARKNAMLPMITLLAFAIPYLIAGAILTETVFTWNGMGLLMYQAVLYQDYPLMQGLFLFLAAATIVCNFAADILYAVADPRIE